MCFMTVTHNGKTMEFFPILSTEFRWINALIGWLQRRAPWRPVARGPKEKKMDTCTLWVNTVGMICIPALNDLVGKLTLKGLEMNKH